LKRFAAARFVFIFGILNLSSSEIWQITNPECRNEILARYRDNFYILLYYNTQILLKKQVV
jgi:hypothetical protein